MLQILALLILTGVAVDVSRRVYSHRAVFAQLHQTTAVAWLVWLYPLPFLFPLCALFFVPALISARTNQKCFEKSGDARVKPALAAVYAASCAGVMGIMGVLVLTFYAWIFVR